MAYASLMTEDVNASQMSTTSSVSIFGGVSEPHLDELRAAREAINGDRNQLVFRYRNIVKLDQDQRDNVSCDYNCHRRQWWQRVVDYMNLARRKHEAGHINDTQLASVASSLDIMAKTWRATAYVDDTLGYDAQPFPTRADALRPSQRVGNKRDLNDFSIGTEVLGEYPPTNRFRSSSPNPTAEGVNVAVEIIPPGENLQIPHVPPTRRQSLGAIGGRPRGLPASPAPRQQDVAAWVNEVAPSPPSSSELQAPTLNVMLRNSAQKKAMEMAQKENKDLKFRLLQADEDANRRINEAVKAKQDEIVEKANVECGAEIEKERQKANAASAAAKEALQTAAAADQRAASANQEAVNAVDMAHRLRKERYHQPASDGGIGGGEVRPQGKRGGSPAPERRRPARHRGETEGRCQRHRTASTSGTGKGEEKNVGLLPSFSNCRQQPNLRPASKEEHQLAEKSDSTPPSCCSGSTPKIRHRHGHRRQRDVFAFQNQRKRSAICFGLHSAFQGCKRRGDRLEWCQL